MVVNFTDGSSLDVIKWWVKTPHTAIVEDSQNYTYIVNLERVVKPESTSEPDWIQEDYKFTSDDEEFVDDSHIFIDDPNPEPDGIIED